MELSHGKTSGFNAEELAIVGLTSSIFDLVDVGDIFLKRFDKLRSKTKLLGSFRALSPLEDTRKDIKWLVAIIRSPKMTAKPSGPGGIDAERRQSVSIISSICVFQLKQLTNRLFVASNSTRSYASAIVSLFGHQKEILQRVRTLNVQTKDLLQLLAFLNNQRPGPALQRFSKLQPFSMVPKAPTLNFIGRDKLMRGLIEDLGTTGQLVLVGPGGIGKTELCIQYADRFLDEDPSRWVFWVNGKDVLRSNAEITRCLRLQQDSDPLGSITKWLANPRNNQWLAILDDFPLADASNLVGYTQGISGRVSELWLSAALNGRGKVLLTSNVSVNVSVNLPTSSNGERILSKDWTIMKVPPISKDHALSFLRSSLQDSGKMADEDASRLVRKVGCRPLALTQVVTDIKAMDMTISECLADLESIEAMRRQLSLEDMERLTEEGDEIQDPWARLVGSDRGSCSKSRVCHHSGKCNCSDIGLLAPTEPSTLAQADVLTISSFMAKTMLAEHSLSSVLRTAMAAKQSIEQMEKLQQMLRGYSKRLECFARGDMQVSCVRFINKHPRRIAFAIMQESAEQDHTKVEEALEITRWATVNGGEQLEKRISKSMRVDSFRRRLMREQAHMAGNAHVAKDSIEQPTAAAPTPVEDMEAIKRFLIKGVPYTCLIDDVFQNIAASPNPQDIHQFALTAIRNADILGRAGLVCCSVTWELLKVMKDSFDGKQQLGQVLAISGGAIDAYAATCQDYVSTMWPTWGSFLLDALDSAKWGLQQAVCDYGGLVISISEAITTGDLQHTLDISVKGAPDAQAEIVATLAWLAAAIRHSEFEVLTTSRMNIRYRSLEANVLFEIECCSLVPFDGPSSCWHSLFVYTAVATGYPIPPRRKGIGLEISFHTLAALARVDRIVERDKGLVLRGLVDMIIPIKELQDPMDNAIQWHLLKVSCIAGPPSWTSETSIGATEALKIADSPRAELVDDCFPGGWLKTRKPQHIKGFCRRRAFLGWCAKALVKVATEDAKYQLDYSDTAEKTRRLNPTAATMSIPLGTKGFGPTIAGTVALPERQNQAILELHHSISNTLINGLHRTMIIYDSDTNRAWLLPYLSVLLHLTHLRAVILGQKDHASMRLSNTLPPFANIHPDASAASFDAMRELLDLLPEGACVETDNSGHKRTSKPVQRSKKKGKQVRNERVKKASDLRDYIADMLSGLDEAEKQLPPLRKNDVDLGFGRGRDVYGFELMDIALGNKHVIFKRRRLRTTSGGWAAIARKQGVMFCHGLGDAIIPADRDILCEQWKEVPEGKDYLTAPVSSLQKSRAPLGRVDVTVMTSNRRKVWEPTLDTFKPCEMVCNHSHCPSCHVVAIKSRPGRFHKKEVLKNLGHYEEGAVIFGSPGRWKRHNLAWKRAFQRVFRSHKCDTEQTNGHDPVVQPDTIRQRSLVSTEESPLAIKPPPKRKAVVAARGQRDEMEFIRESSSLTASSSVISNNNPEKPPTTPGSTPDPDPAHRKGSTSNENIRLTQALAGKDDDPVSQSKKGKNKNKFRKNPSKYNKKAEQDSQLKGVGGVFNG